MFEELYKDLQEAPDKTPIIPQGSYQGQVSGYKVDEVQMKSGEKKDIIRISITLQGNQGFMLTDNKTPVDGQTVEYGIFLPAEDDKLKPSRFGRGTMWDISVHKLKRFFRTCGVDLEAAGSLEEALGSAVGATLTVEIADKMTEDGSLYDYVRKLV